MKIATPLAPVRKVMEGYAQVSLVLVCLILLVSLASGLMLSQIALRPLRVIQETADPFARTISANAFPSPTCRMKSPVWRGCSTRCSTAWKPRFIKYGVLPPKPRTS